jgi:hypothetical protein
MRIEIQIHAFGGTLEKMEWILIQEAIAEMPGIGKNRRDDFRFLA